ncbi:wax ester/triacylglycerol synthase family O-acyltransferase [Hyphomonas sp.]|uniref:WS/DGAT/MGAT family O-acyltransferase n=1 Tax=Hyphomonas sp. TaxID=87 RepID=UPI0032EBC7F7
MIGPNPDETEKNSNLNSIRSGQVTMRTETRETVRVMEQLQGSDASFVAFETPSTPMHIGSILIYDPSTAPGGFVRFKDILAFMRSRLQLSKTMRRRLVRTPFNIDYPYWVEDANFDLEYHVRHVALPKPGDWRQLYIQASRIFARPLDLSRPPWEITVVEGLDNVEGIPKGSFAMLTKVHHAAVDGASGVDLLEALHTTTPQPEPLTTPDTWKPDKFPNYVGMFAKGYARAWVNPIRRLSVSAQSVPGVYRMARGMVRGDFGMKAALQAPKTAFNGKVSPHRVIDGRVFELKHIKAMRALSEGAKVNDVMLSIIGGALNKYLEAKGELPEKSLTAAVPISVRTTDEKNAMGNQVAAMVAPIGTHISDPVERMVFVHEQTQRSKAMTNAMGARQMSELSKTSPALFMALGAQMFSRFSLADITRPVINTAVTNVPGPPVPLYSCGAKLVSMQGMICLFDGFGLAHVVQSYIDEATISFTACRDAMPDPEFYAQCIQQSFEEMANAAGIDLAQPKPSMPKAQVRRKSAARGGNSRIETSAKRSPA